MDTPIPINPPLKIIVEQIFNNFKVKIGNIILGNSVQLLVSLFNDERFVTTRVYLMKDNDYLQWGTQDSYVYDWILQQLQKEIS